MASAIINTTDRYTQLICNTSSELIGDWPNITFRMHYNFQVRLTNYGSWYYNGFRLTFHNNVHVINLACSFGSGGGTTGVLAGGYIDLGLGGQSTTHAPGFTCSGCFSGNGVAYETQTIPNGSLSSNLGAYDHNSCIINVALSSPRNYFYTAIYNGATLLKTCGSGAQEIVGLSAGTWYTLDIKLINRDGAVLTTQKVNFRTNGFSYLDGNVTTLIGNYIAFPVRTYDDSFTTRVKVTCGSIVLREVDVKSSGKVYNFYYTPSDPQLNSIYALIPKALSVAGTITLTTYIGGSAVGSTSYTITYNVNQVACAPSIISFDYIDTVQKAIDKTANNQWVLQNVSKLQIKSIEAYARSGATITSYRVSIGNNTVNSATFPINVNAVVESDSGIYLTVIDSRGLQITKFMAFTKFIKYALPYFTSISLTRVNDVEEATTLNMKGVFDRLPINSVDKNIVLNFKYRYRVSDSSTWSAYVTKPVTLNSSEFSYNNVIGNFNSDASYVFECVIDDYFYSAINSESMLMKGTFELFIGDGTVEVNGKLKQNDFNVLDTSSGVTKDANVTAHMTLSDGYPGFDNTNGGYIRTPVNGLLPNKLGNVTGSIIGSPKWKFANGYFTNFNVSGYIDAQTVYTDQWFRSRGATGWYSEIYGGGIHMKDSTYVRVYNNKRFHCDNIISSAIGFYQEKAGLYCTTGNAIAGFRAVYGNGAGKDYFEISQSRGAWGIDVWSSDKSLKKNIRDTKVNEVLNKISQIKHVEFDWKDGGSHTELGYVADDLEEILPCLIFNVEQPDDEDGNHQKPIKNVSHTTLIPLITMAMQELIKENEYVWQFNEEMCNAIIENCNDIDTLKSENIALKERLDKLEMLICKNNSN